MLRLAAIASCVFCSWACDLLGPTCLGRQQRGTVTTIAGRVEPGQMVSHLVRYETSGSQNDADIQWAGYRSEGGPRITVYATRAGCVDFEPSAAAGACAILSRAGTLPSGNIATTLIVTHGRGNPEVLGQPAEYKIWVVGDPEQTAHYTISITWFFGPDC
jgi:hypothetical protein